MKSVRYGQNFKRQIRSIRVLALCLVFVFLMGCGIPNAAGTSKAAEKFLGEWQDETGSVILDVWKEDSGLVHGEVCWIGEENRIRTWSFTGTARGNTFTYKECTQTRVSYNDDWEASEEVVYTGGTGKLTLGEESLSWEDDQTPEAAGVAFSYVGEY